MDEQRHSEPGCRLKSPGGRGWAARRASGLCPAALVLLASLAATGCGRDYYRRQADNDAYQIIGCAARDERWAVAQYGIDPRYEARFFDTYDPDRPPMPADDPEAHKLMHCVDGKEGYQHWHDDGDICEIENPSWRDYLVRDEEGNVVLAMEDAVRLGYVHSRTYQQQLETLYLSALDVSFERFRFDSQFFGGNDTFFTSQGRRRSPPRGRNELRSDTGLQMRKLMTSGGSLVVDFANSFVWQFTGTNTETATSLLSFNLVQPLLRFGGRPVVMERLTRTERILLYNVRSMYRYRQGFFVSIASGSPAVQGPNRAGGVFGGAGLEGFTGVGGGGFGQVGTATGGASAGGAGGAGGAGAAQVGGYLGLLQDQLNIEYLRDRVVAMQGNLEVFKAFEPQNLVDPFQVRSAEQTLSTVESQLLSAVAQYEGTLDQFKNTLGLPPDVKLVIKDDILEPFILQSKELNEVRAEGDRARLAILPDIQLVATFAKHGRTLWPLPETEPLTELMRPAAGRVRTERERFGALKNFEGALAELSQARKNILGLEEFLAGLSAAEALQQHTAAVVPQVDSQMRRWDEALPQRLEGLRHLKWEDKAQELQEDMKTVNADFETIRMRLGQTSPWLRDRESVKQQVEATQLPIETLENLLKASRPNLQKLYDLDEQLEKITAQLNETKDPQLAQQRDELEKNFLEEFARQEQAIVDLSQRLEPAARALYLQGVQPAVDSFARLRQRVYQLADDGSDLGIIEARARLEAIVMPPVRVDEDLAVCLARHHRLDWMNARGAVVDSWRLIEFNADDLESDLDVVFSGDLGTINDDPFRFRSPTGQLRVGLQFDSPTTRLAERNSYRQALIEYQQARRSYMNYVDGVWNGLRGTLRTIRVNEENLERRREALNLAFEQFDFARLRLFAPPQLNAQRNPNIANDVVASLQAIQLAQTDFLSVWVNSYVQRMVLDRDLGTMMLDEQGIWVDPRESIGEADPCCPRAEDVPKGESSEELPSAEMPQGPPEPGTETTPSTETPASPPKGGMPLPAPPKPELDGDSAIPQDGEPPLRTTRAESKPPAPRLSPPLLLPEPSTGDGEAEQESPRKR
ncbi:MAG: hypothetical protein HYS13_19685 [Planctomycetia bacterium]|nr:hypothetical protein [Planctomycetia bacterium]